MSVGERDPHSGYMTTGHEWNGIKELNTPVPRPVWLFLIASFLISVMMWVLLPAWPLGSTFTRGALGYNERAALDERVAVAASARASWMTPLETMSYEEARADSDLLMRVKQTGQTLFGDNCAACHGVEAKGGPGYPNLVDTAWLWGGDIDAISETLRVGINTEHPDTQYAQMPSLGRDGALDKKSILRVISYVQSLSNPAIAEEAPARVAEGNALFAENCSSCHGEDAKGIQELGAPNLADKAWIYGGDRASLYQTIQYGRNGHMPAWEGRLSEAERRLLAIYLLDLAESQPQ